jgi:hypothetical protein
LSGSVQTGARSRTGLLNLPSPAAALNSIPAAALNWIPLAGRKPKPPDGPEANPPGSSEILPGRGGTAAISIERTCQTIEDAARANELPVEFLTHLIWQES